MEEEKWSQGRPVFKKVEGAERFLFVPEGVVLWSIRNSLTASYVTYVLSGRGTNSPTAPEAGSSDKLGVHGWRFWDNSISNFAEGGISLTCK